MRYSKLFGKTTKNVPKDEVAVNARLLLQAGFIDKLMSGSYTLLPLGFMVKEKIEQIIREEIDSTGAQELLMPLLHPKDIWNETGRWESAKEVMYRFKKGEKDYALSFTHEEIFLDVVRKHITSYKDLPVKVYHFSTKFRDEPRARSGILRGREFIMKDLYSLHTTKEDLDNYYELVAGAYMKAFKRLGLNVVRTEAAGGVFTPDHTDEFQLISDVGEDEIIYCPGGDFAQNLEIIENPEKLEEKQCDLGHGPLQKAKSIEVGNIFRFGTSYCEKMQVQFVNENGQKQYPYLGSYGIGITRLIGALVEKFADERGLVWSEVVAPFQAHLIEIRSSKSEVRNKSKSQNPKFKTAADFVYDQLENEGIEVLYDDRDVSAGEKFADADLLGMPVRLVISERTLQQSSGQAGEEIEWKERTKEEKELLTLEEVIERLKNRNSK